MKGIFSPPMNLRATALPMNYTGLLHLKYGAVKNVVGVERFELPAPWSQARCPAAGPHPDFVET